MECNRMYLGPRLGINLPHRLGCHCGRQFVGRGSCWIETTEEWSRVLVQGGSERLRPMCVELVAMINWIGRSVGFSVFKNHLTAELGRLSPWQGDEKSVCAWKFKGEVCRDRTSVVLDSVGRGQSANQAPCASPKPPAGTSCGLASKRRRPTSPPPAYPRSHTSHIHRGELGE